MLGFQNVLQMYANFNALYLGYLTFKALWLVNLLSICRVNDVCNISDLHLVSSWF